MDKEVLIHVRGLQTIDADGDQEPVEIVVPGEYYFRNSDAIIVLDHGKIIERGDHEDLIKLKGTYYQLYTGKLELS